MSRCDGLNLVGGEGWARWCRPGVLLAAVAVGAGCVLAAASQASAEPEFSDPRLSATLVGRLEPGQSGRLAVRWDGEPGALLDVWVDLDGDGDFAPEELVVEGRPLEPGIEVVSFEVAPEGRVVPGPRVLVEARGEGSGEAEELADAGGAARARDGCGWQPGFSVADLDAEARAMTVFDDGLGPALYVGGAFTSASGLLVNGIARWDGSTWSPLSGPSGTGMGGSAPDVYALAVYDDGSGPALYAGGWFGTAGGMTVHGVAKWDGSAWSALSGPSGTGTNHRVSALAVFDDGTGPGLYAGGAFTTAGGVTVKRIARWDGTAWSALSGPYGVGVDNEVVALAVFDDGSGPALYAGGWFGTAGGMTVYGVAKWDGSAWSALSGPYGVGMDSWVSALAVYDDGTGPALYAGGSFSTAGGARADCIARWDGSGWTALRWGLDSYVASLAVFDDGSGPALYAGGRFGSASGVLVYRIARWDGSSWSALSGPSGTGMGGYNAFVGALAVYDDGSGPALFAGGTFSTAGGVTAHGIARWGGDTWSALSGSSGAGMGGYYPRVGALEAQDDGCAPVLYAAGWFSTAGGVTVNRIARWDGTGWSTLAGPSGTGMNSHVAALAVFDDGSGPALYAGGSFSTAGGVTVNHIARWDGTGWSTLAGPSGTGMSSAVEVLAVFDDGSGPALYTGGLFNTAGGVTVNRIARWDGSTWSALSGPSGIGTGGSQPYVFALTVFDDGFGAVLYAGGDFTTAGGVTVNRIARWDGSAWSALSGPAGTGMNDQVHALEVFDDGSGPTLYAGGDFMRSGGLPSSRIAAWRCPETAPPSDPTALTSTTHTSGVWSPSDVIGVEWSGATDSGGSGLAGYSVLFDMNPATLPDTTVEVPQGMDPHSTTSSALPAGQDQWFHLRACDHAGNCSAGLHLGPFWVDATGPTNPVSLASTNHSPGAWSSTNVIAVEWSGAADSGGSGLAGYSVLFDTSSATLPDSTVDVPQGADPHSTASAALPDGQDHWFHLRACDHADNCSTGVHLGPFWVDATPPSGPFDLTSTSHTPGVPTLDPKMDFTWSPALDTGSGLDGYAYAVTGTAAWACDQVKDLEEGETSLTTPELPDNPWYVHLCATDTLGNWGDVVTAGPYLIGAIFADGFEEGDTLGWAEVVP